MNAHDIIIVFGAGASFGAGCVLPAAPPLGAHLYDALAKAYPNVWGSESVVGNMWSAQLRNDFERAMSEEILPKTPSLCLLEWHRDIAVFFAQYRLDAGRRDMYSLLLSELKTKGLLPRVMLASLNYDCLLEQAMLDLGLGTDYMLDPFPSEGSIPLAKIHGSCTFITDNLFSKRAYLTNANASSLECSIITLPLQSLEDRLRRSFSTHDPALFPVLGLYSPDKPSIVAPAKLQTLRNALTDRINRATTLVLIGVRPNPRDPHLWCPIAQSRASTISYIGSSNDYRILKTIQAKAIHVGETFEAGLAPVVRALSDPTASIRLTNIEVDR